MTLIGIGTSSTDDRRLHKYDFAYLSSCHSYGYEWLCTLDIALFDQDSGEESELIGWEIEGRVVTHSDALLKAHDLSWLDS
jgi:hypothetical protein